VNQPGGAYSTYLSSFLDRLLEKDTPAWTRIALLNPRHNRTLVIDFMELVRLGSGGLSSIEVIELFSFVTGDYALKEVAELRLQ